MQLLPEAQLPVPAPLPQQPELPALAPPVLAHLVVEAAASVEEGLVDAVPEEFLLSRQSFSAAMARSSP